MVLCKKDKEMGKILICTMQFFQIYYLPKLYLKSIIVCVCVCVCVYIYICYIYICITESLCHTAEINTTL